VSNLERVRTLIERLTTRGCVFALDDFGSGVSSFAYLRDLRVSHLKIDGRFVSRMLTDSVDYNIVGAACAVAGSLNIKTVAEWVENQEILERLHTLNVDLAQGFGIGRPEPLETLFERPVIQRVG
jgi:EAL domain-containing protein (putative c-di-GMP-specific phosphodiesterase class I)